MLGKPRAQRRAVQRREAAAGREAGELPDPAPGVGRGDEPVVERGRQRGHAHEPGETGDEPRAERHAVGVVVVLLPLRLGGGRRRRWTGTRTCRPCADRQRSMTSFTCRLSQAFRPARESVSTWRSRLARARVVSCSLRVAVARAHGAAHAMGFQALAGARAFLGGAQDATGGTEIEKGGILRRGVARAVAQRGVHRRRVDDLAGIENVLRVESLLDAAHQRVALVAHHEADEFAAQATVAVFAGEQAVFLHPGRRHPVMMPRKNLSPSGVFRLKSGRVCSSPAPAWA